MAALNPPKGNPAKTVSNHAAIYTVFGVAPSFHTLPKAMICVFLRINTSQGACKTSSSGGAFEHRAMTGRLHAYPPVATYHDVNSITTMAYVS
jgi:hypothetical protein